jgi:hypothetical protein
VGHPGSLEADEEALRLAVERLEAGVLDPVAPLDLPDEQLRVRVDLDA